MTEYFLWLEQRGWDEIRRGNSAGATAFWEAACKWSEFLLE